MELFVVLFLVAVYIVLSIVFITFIAVKCTDKPSRTAFAIAFVILLPTWDVLLGLVAYYPARLLVPKTAVYETATANSIYFEGMNNCLLKLERRGRERSDAELMYIPGIDHALAEGFCSAEAKVTEEDTMTAATRSIKPLIYRCTAAPWGQESPDFLPTYCSPVGGVQSRYMTKERALRIGITQVRLKRIIDLSTKKLMGKSSNVCIEKRAFPFFNWLGWAWWDRGVTCSPNSERYDRFEYEVVRPERPRDRTIPIRQWWGRQ